MKFPRNARIFRGQLDVTSFGTVFFLLVLLLMLASLVTYTPGVRVELPEAGDLPGTDKPTVKVGLTKDGRIYFEQQPIEEEDLKVRLQQAVKSAPEPLTLLVLMDREVTYESWLRLTLLAREAGISDSLLATLPRAITAPGLPSAP